ncbi:MAG: NAD(P)-binding protein [Rhizobiales bacterium]|nr:NAD(P)-binding protein [Hyphomicrobiales bacterium]
MRKPFHDGDAVNALIDAAYFGRISRRSFIKGLVAAGFTVAAARDMAEQAAHAQSNQAARIANLKNEYDFIIVGAGASGCVLAQRLSQDGRASVLVIEGGGTNLDQDKIRDPRVYARNFGTDTDWGYKSTPQKHLNNRVIVAPVGKIIGGGSSINATVWLKGDKADYDQWEAAAGPNWSFNHIVRNFKKVERYAGGESVIRGGEGMIATRKPAVDHPATRAFIESAVGLGKKEELDVNDVASLTNIVGQQDINVTADMRRISAAHAYLLPALSRGNLTLLPATTVTRLDIAGEDCRGVIATVDGQERRFSAVREVIVCAGGLQSPKLLMLSGIGPADHLRQFGIAVVKDAPQVGANLHDHMLVRLVFATKVPMAPPVDTGHAGITYHRSSSSLAGPNIQIFGRLNAPNVPNLPSDHGYLTMPGLMKPASRGTVRLASADPSAPLMVDPNYFAEQADVDAYVASVELATAIGNGKGFDGIRKEQVSIPGAGRAQIIDYIRANAATYFHFVGTCAMGSALTAPVDEDLRVRGVRRLRVADASVMPVIPCCNTHAPTLSLAERAAELVLAARAVGSAN